MALHLLFPRDRPDYRELVSQVTSVVWPEFMHHDPIAIRLWDSLYQRFDDYQFALYDTDANAIAGLANSVPLSWNQDERDLPEEGLDWALQQSALDSAGGVPIHTLCGLQIVVAPAYQGKGLSRRLIDELLGLARRKDLVRVVVPVRPSLKERYPSTHMDAYIQWLNGDGLPFDPWLRTHVRAGGRMVKVCHRAMTITGRVLDWEGWTRMHFPTTGSYIVPGALIAVDVNIADDVGTYVEPNVWVTHGL